MEQQREKKKPEVLIVGAGIAGLMLGILLEQIGIQYHIFERASEVKPLGSAMALSNFAAFEQLGIYEELLKISKPLDSVCFYLDDSEPIFQNTGLSADRLGYDCQVFSRPDFYDVLLRRVPSEKISFKKKILKTEEKDGKVIIHCSDNTAYIGDILVGADGAYSGVRQSLYKEMNDKGLLPNCDLENFSIGYTVTVGVAKVDSEKYPVLKEDRVIFRQMIFNGNSNCFIVPLPNNQISWGLGTQQLSSDDELKDMQFRSSGWGEDSSESAIKPYRDHPSPVGGTMGDLFDATPKDLISKVYTEEKIFNTWHHGRTALIGD
ncbi:hypothetical protein BGZ76_001043, partial [Entomortierella beljakovae]